MKTFFIVGPTAVGKSELAAEAARRIGAEIVNADAFQLYSGLDLLTGKPDRATVAKAPHHLLGTVPLGESMNAERFRAMALEALNGIHSRGKPAIVVGGSGLYIKALTHGLSPLPSANAALREELDRATISELSAQLWKLDPETARGIDHKNKRRLIRAVEVCLISGTPLSAQRTEWMSAPSKVTGAFVVRNRDELYERINRRVEKMFVQGVLDEVRTAHGAGLTAVKMLGLCEIQALLAGEISEAECIATIQRLTRNYAKRQLTWFQRQDIFVALNLSVQGWQEAIELIAQNPHSAFAQVDD